jgi:hypothetical protein
MQILSEQYSRDVIKRECWDAMDVPGSTLYAFNSKLETSNFPIRKRTQSELKQLARVKMIRKVSCCSLVRWFYCQIEIGEARVVRKLAVQSQNRNSFEPGLRLLNISDQVTDWMAARPEDDEEDEREDSLYDPLALSSTHRKRHQLILLQVSICITFVHDVVGHDLQPQAWSQCGLRGGSG